MENSSEVGALADFCRGKSLKAISKHIWSKEAKLELIKINKIPVKSARIGAKRVLSKYYDIDYTPGTYDY